MPEPTTIERIASDTWLEGIDLEPVNHHTQEADADQRKSIVRDAHSLLQQLGVEIDETTDRPVSSGRSLSGEHTAFSGLQRLITNISPWVELTEGCEADEFVAIHARIVEVTERRFELNGIAQSPDEIEDLIAEEPSIATTSARVEKIFGEDINNALLRRWGLFNGVSAQPGQPLPMFSHHAREAAWRGFVSTATVPCMYRTELITGQMLGDKVADVEMLARGMSSIAFSTAPERAVAA